MQYIKSLHALVTGIDIGSDIAERVAYVQTRSAGVREHVENIELGL